MDMEIIYLVVGIGIGGIIGWIILRSRTSVTREVAEEKIRNFTELLNNTRNELEIKEGEIIELNRHLSAKEADHKNLQERLEQQKTEIEKIQERFQAEFKNLANEIFDEKSKKFTEHNRLKLDELLKPLDEKIKDFEKKVEETYDKEAQQRFSLKEEVKRLAELNQQVSKEASNLTRALKGDSKTRGNWGEMILENILEKSGLEKNREYFIQPSFTDEEGKRLQPDVVVAYPGNRSVVIDSKVSLNAYEKFVAAEDDEKKEGAMKEHLQSIRNHIRELSEKNYQDIFDLKSLDFVMMFLPVEPAYYLAVQNDTGLWTHAYEKRILLISPTNLIAALRMVESMWQQEYQNKNVLEIARQSGALYDKFEGLVNDLLDVGRKLDMAKTSYESSMKKLSEGKGNLVSRVEQIKKLGAKTQKTLPPNLIERAEINNPDTLSDDS